MAKGLVTLPIGFKRVDAEPLEANVLFTTLEAAQAYANDDPTSYPGQALYVANADDQTVKAYLVKFDKSLANIGEVPQVELDWSAIQNKPQINGHDLVSGDNTLESLGIQAKGNYVTDEDLATKVNNVITTDEIVKESIKGLGTEAAQAEITKQQLQNATQVGEAIDAKIANLGSLLTLKGRKDSYSELSSIEDPKAGDVWLVGASEAPELEEYVYTADSKWEKLGITSQVDLSDYVTNSKLSEELAKYVTTETAESTYAKKDDGITTEEREKLAKIKTDGEGQQVLTDAGTYVNLPKPDTGVSDYSELTGKPQIAGVELASGNNTLEALGIDASTIVLKDNIVVTGTSWGNIGDGTTLNKGTSLEAILNQALRKRIAASYTQPTVTLTGTGSSPVECGTKQDITLTQKFTQNDAGAATQYVLKQGEEELQSDATGEPKTLSQFTIPEGTTTFTSTVTYEAGEVKNDNFGEPSPTGKIEAGSKTASKQYVGQRMTFYQAHSSDLPISTSANIRSLTGTKLGAANNTSIAITIEEGTMCVVIAYPASLGDLEKIVQKATGYDIKDSFDKTTVEVEGANAYQATTYNVYKYAPAAPLKADTFTVTI